MEPQNGSAEAHAESPKGVTSEAMEVHSTKSKIELIEDALLKNVGGGTCYHQTCYHQTCYHYSCYSTSCYHTGCVNCQGN